MVGLQVVPLRSYFSNDVIISKDVSDDALEYIFSYLSVEVGFQQRIYKVCCQFKHVWYKFILKQISSFFAVMVDDINTITNKRMMFAQVASTMISFIQQSEHAIKTAPITCPTCKLVDTMSSHDPSRRYPYRPRCKHCTPTCGKCGSYMHSNGATFTMHQMKCCEQQVCERCIKSCSACREGICCPDCSLECLFCHTSSCGRCIGEPFECDACHRVTYCKQCQSRFQICCGKRLCSGCSRSCTTCHKTICSLCSTPCHGCVHSLCSDCTLTCGCSEQCIQTPRSYCVKCMGHSCVKCGVHFTRRCRHGTCDCCNKKYCFAHLNELVYLDNCILACPLCRTRCRHCEQTVVRRDSVRCTVCRGMQCKRCVYSCPQCSNIICRECRLKCSTCHENCCQKCLDTCNQCREQCCTRCSITCHNQTYHKHCLTACTTCNKPGCPRCSTTCSSCSRLCCTKCNTCHCGETVCTECQIPCGYCHKRHCKDTCMRQCNGPRCNGQVRCAIGFAECSVCRTRQCKGCLHRIGAYRYKCSECYRL